jgi:hypothetical protein
LAPDLYILKQGQRAEDVGVLMCMPLAIALMVCNALVTWLRCELGAALGTDVH